MDLDQYVAVGLYDPDAPDADERRALLEAVSIYGASPELLAELDRTVGLTWVPVVLPLLAPSGYTVTEVAERLGFERKRIEAYLDAAGLPRLDDDAAPFTDEDLDMFRAWAAVADFVPMELGGQLLRAAGASSARIAEAGIATFVAATSSDQVDTGGSDLERILYNQRALGTYFGAADTFTQLLRHHMRSALERWYLAGEAAPRGMVRFYVGFLDLVGYTPLSHRLAPAELSALVDRFEMAALSAAATHNGRIVKHIGDEVMFVANTADAALDMALTMVEEFGEGDDGQQTTPRGGVAVGDLLAREGDFYGPAVNLASRIADLAVPEEILVSEAVRDDGEAAAFTFEPAGRRQLKGFPEPVQLFATHRA